MRNGKLAKTNTLSSLVTILTIVGCAHCVRSHESDPSGDAGNSLTELARYFDFPLSPAQVQEVLAVQQEGGASTKINDTAFLKKWNSLVDVVHKLNLPLAERKLSLEAIYKRGGIVLMRLHQPDETVILKSLGSRDVLVQKDKSDTIIARKVLAKRFRGETIVFTGGSGRNAARATTALRVDEPVRLVRITSLGTSSEIVETVPLYNRGNKPLLLKVEGTSCGCTGAEVSPRVLAPGQTATLTMKMQSEGSRLVMVNLRTDDPRWPRAVIALQSQEPKVKINVPSPVHLSAVQGKSATASTELVLPKGIAVTKITSSQPFISTHLGEGTRRQGASADQAISHPLSVTIAATAPVGSTQAHVVVQLKGSDVRQITVPINAYVNDGVMAEPSMLNLGTINYGATIHKTISLKAPADRVFSVQSIRSTSPGITAKVTEGTAANHTVEINIKAMGEVGTVLQDRITLSLSDKRELNVDVLGSITGGPGAQEAALLPRAEDDRSVEIATASPTVQTGQAAPIFKAVDIQGQEWTPSSLRGKKNLLLTFFPKCFTGGCANHLSSLRDHQAEFDAADTQVLAVSVDAAEGEKGQRAFSAQWRLTFPLIPDTQRTLSQLFGAAQNDKQLSARMSILIDKAGIVRWIDTNVNVQTHGTDVLAKMLELGMAK